MVDMTHQNLSATIETLVTGEELAQMGDIGRCELVEGRVVQMSPTGDDRWTEIQRKLGEYFSAGVDQVWLVDSAKKQYRYTAHSQMSPFLTKMAF